MKLLNRSAVAVLAREPMADWIKGLPLDELTQQGVPTLQELRREGSIYLIDEVESEADFTREISKHWQAVLENELGAWDELGEHWPELSFELFNRWLEVQPQVICFDLAESTLLMAPLDNL